MGQATGLLAMALATLVASGCGMTDDDPEQSRLEPLHGAIDPEVLAAPVAIPVAPTESTVAIGQWRVAEIVDGRTLVLYRGLERATAVIGGIVVPVEDDCLADRATDSLAFITGGGRAVTVRPPTSREGLIDGATVFTADDEDVAAAMLSLGLARVDEDAEPPSPHLEAEERARQESVGVWGDECS